MLDVPEAKRGWGRAAEFVDAIIQADRDVTPLKFEASERWRAEVLAIWRGCTVDDLTAQGLVTIAPEPKPVDETWRVRLEALCADHGWRAVLDTPRKIVAGAGGDAAAPGNCIGHMTETRYSTVPRPFVGVYVARAESNAYALDFRPLHHEAEGRSGVSAARAAFDRASAFADLLEAAGPWPFEWPVVDVSEDDIPF